MSTPLLLPPPACACRIRRCRLKRPFRTRSWHKCLRGRDLLQSASLCARAESTGRTPRTTRATAVFTVLAESGVEPGDVVAILGPRCFALVGAMLGVLMGRGAFLTIDPELPEARKRVMLNEARVKAVCVIGQTAGCECLIEAANISAVLRTDVDLISVDRTAGLGPARRSDQSWPPHTIRGDDPAYVFFTSGSTGRPKAILSCHDGLSHFLHWQRETFAIGTEDRVSQLIGLTFDPLLRDIFLPLTSGATLCIPDEDDLLDTIGWIKREGITVVHTTPTLMQSWLIDTGPETDLERRRWVFVGGEPLTDVLIGKWRRQISGSARLVNLYGSSETPMARCFYPVPAGGHAGSSSRSDGRCPRPRRWC